MVFIGDTNFLVSAAIKPSSIPSIVLNIILKDHELLFNWETFKELKETLDKDKFKKYLALSDKDSFLNNLVEKNTFKVTHITTNICRDPKDNMFLSLAEEYLADFIITGDMDLLIIKQYKSIKIITPREALEVINNH